MSICCATPEEFLSVYLSDLNSAERETTISAQLKNRIWMTGVGFFEEERLAMVDAIRQGYFRSTEEGWTLQDLETDLDVESTDKTVEEVIGCMLALSRKGKHKINEDDGVFLSQRCGSAGGEEFRAVKVVFA